MNDDEWKTWAVKLDRLLDRISLVDDVDELRGLADGIQQWDNEGLEACERNTGMGWTWHMGGDWNEAVGQLQDHLEKFDPKEFDAMVKRRGAATAPEGGSS